MLVLTYISVFVTVLGVIIGIYQIISDRIKSERKQREATEFNKSNEILPFLNLSSRVDSADIFTKLLKRLINATAESVRFTKFEHELRDKYTIAVNAESQSEYLPGGLTLFIIGISKDPEQDAEKVFSQLSVNDDRINLSSITCIYITPYLWPQREKWILKRKHQYPWKDLVIYDASVLARWLKEQPTVLTWLEIKYFGKYPLGAVIYADEYWDEWSTGPKLVLNPDLLLGGRKMEEEKVTGTLSASGVLAVQGLSRDESLAFIISCFRTDDAKAEDFFSRSLIVDNQDTFRRLIESAKSLILIPRFEDDGLINMAVSKGHVVFVPLGPDSRAGWDNKLILPKLDREAFVVSLTKSGMEKEVAEKYSRETARSVTILRRQLGFSRSLPNWAKPENVRDIIPAMLIGRWNETFEGDRKAVEEIAGEIYEQYIQKLTKWLHTSDSPVAKIGASWRLASPLDAWTNASQFLNARDFEHLRSCFSDAANTINPVFDLQAEQRYKWSFQTKKQYNSDWLMEGLIQSLILISVFGDELKLDLDVKSDIWVDDVILNLLKTDNILIWKSIEEYLPLLAEASPKSFLTAVENHLAREKSPVEALFETDPGFISPHSYHTGLLWGLEGIAWLPNYLSRASLVLAKLSAIEFKSNLSNTPINSLTEIFKPWHFQTFATFEDRIEVLHLIADREKKIAWDFLIQLLPLQQGIAHPTHKMRWRLFDHTFDRSITYREIWNTHSSVVGLLLTLFDFSEAKLSVLLERSTAFSKEDRDKTLSFIESNIENVLETEYSAWNTLRDILNRQRSYPDTDWALPESELSRYDDLYFRLQPKDEIQQSIWLFDDAYPKTPEGVRHKIVSYEQQNKIISDKRIGVLRSLYAKFGVTKIAELRFTVKMPSILGDTLGYILENKSEILFICRLLKDDMKDFRFIHGFVVRKSFLKGLDYIIELYNDLTREGIDGLLLAQLFIPLDQTGTLWTFLDSIDRKTKDQYWNNMTPFFFNVPIDTKILGVSRLIEFRRYRSAIDISSHFHADIPSNLIIEMLWKSVSEESNEKFHIEAYEINTLFEELDKRNDVERDTLIKLEWRFLPVLASYGSGRSPKLLHDELSKNPDFFIEVLKCIYKPHSDDILEREKESLRGISEEQVQMRAEQAYDLLYSWAKIPGVDPSGNIDEKVLTGWITTVRASAAACARTEVADVHIAKILAQYPERDKNWPPDEICTIIENINTDSLRNNFAVAIFNKRGTITKAVFEGGEQELGLAKHFNELALNRKNKFPIVASILENVSKSYEEDARREDERAEKDKLEY